MIFIKYIKSQYFFKQFGLFIVLSSFVLYFLFVWLKITTKHDQKIQVPDLSKMQKEEVNTILGELNLLFEVIDSTSFKPDYPKKSVVDQFPKKCSFVKENRKIYLTLNPSKYRDIEIESFYGKTKNEVVAQLRSIGFKIGKISYIPDFGQDVVRKLKHKGKEIQAGNKLAKKSVIDMVLGDGKRR